MRKKYIKMHSNPEDKILRGKENIMPLSKENTNCKLKTKMRSGTKVKVECYL
jgi:hypothetical protein